MTEKRPLVPLLVLGLLAVVALAAVVMPSGTLRPDIVHTEELVESSYRLDIWGRWIARLLLMMGAGLFVVVWRRGGGVARGVATAPLLLLAGTAWFSGERVVEWLRFEQPETIRSVAHKEATHVLAEQTPISGRLGDMPVLIAVAADGRSVRAFERRIDGMEIDLYGKPGVDPPVFLDGATGTEFDFRGMGISGEWAGRQLPKLAAITEFWFDWHNYHPHTELYRGGSLPGR